MEALVKLKSRGIMVKVNTIIMPGINDDHIPDIAEKVSGLGADIMNLMPLVPVKGAAFEEVPPPDTLTTARLRLQCGQLLPQMTHCARCRADAVGYIGENMTTEQHDALKHFAECQPESGGERRAPFCRRGHDGRRAGQPASWRGRTLWRLSSRTRNARQFPAERNPPAPPERRRRSALGRAGRYIERLPRDLVNAAGPTPQKVLPQHGLKVVEMEGLIDEGLSAVFADSRFPPHETPVHQLRRGRSAKAPATAAATNISSMQPAQPSPLNQST